VTARENASQLLGSAATRRRFLAARLVAPSFGDKSPNKKAMTSHRTPKKSRPTMAGFELRPDEPVEFGNRNQIAVRASSLLIRT